MGAFNYTQHGVKRRDSMRSLWPLESHSQEAPFLATGLRGACIWDLGKGETHGHLWDDMEGTLRDS